MVVVMRDRVYEICGQDHGATACARSRILFTVPRAMARVTGVVFVDAKAACEDRNRVLRGQRSRVNIAFVVAYTVGGEWRFRFVCTDLHQQCAAPLSDLLSDANDTASQANAHPERCARTL